MFVSQVVFGNHRYISLHYYYSHYCILLTFDTTLFSRQNTTGTIFVGDSLERDDYPTVFEPPISPNLIKDEDVPQDFGNPSLPD
jgi:hypothetical protein